LAACQGTFIENNLFFNILEQQNVGHISIFCDPFIWTFSNQGTMTKKLLEKPISDIYTLFFIGFSYALFQLKKGLLKGQDDTFFYCWRLF
jgi:hypothetical protein